MKRRSVFYRIAGLIILSVMLICLCACQEEITSPENDASEEPTQQEIPSSEDDKDANPEELNQGTLEEEAQEEEENDVEETETQTETPSIFDDFLDNGTNDAYMDLALYYAKTDAGGDEEILSSYALIYQTFLQRYEASQYGATDYQAAINLFLSKEKMRELNWSYKSAGDFLADDLWRTAFSQNGEDYGTYFLGFLSDMADENGNIVNESGETVAAFEDLGDGTLSFDISDCGKLAAHLGVKESVVRTICAASKIYSEPFTTFTVDDIIGLLEDTGTLTETDGKQQADIGALLDQMIAEGLEESDIFTIIQAVQNVEELECINVPDDIGAVIDSFASSENQTTN